MSRQPFLTSASSRVACGADSPRFTHTLAALRSPVLGDAVIISAAARGAVSVRFETTK